MEIVERPKKTDENEKYEQCCLFDGGKCGPHKRIKPCIDGLFETKQLNIDVKNHLINLKIMQSNEKNMWDEKRLIENRLGRTLAEGELLCASHRYLLGIGWKPPKLCQHPQHMKTPGKKAAPGRSAPIKHILALSAETNVNIPIGSLICHSHRLEKVENNIEILFLQFWNIL